MAMPNRALIVLATGWGPKHGGINSFNYDWVRAFGVAYGPQMNVLCVVPTACPEDRKEAKRSLVDLFGLPYPPIGLWTN
jgi:hypothetical protein